MTELDDRFSLQKLFGDYCESLAKSYPIVHAGIAHLDSLNDDFVLWAQWYAAEDFQGTPYRRFDRTDTVGDWVLQHRRRFVARTIKDVAPFPATFTDFEEAGYQSNAVELIDHAQQYLFFVLSRVPNAFSEQVALNAHTSALPQIIRLAQHSTEPPLEAATFTRMSKLLQNLGTQYGRMPTLDEIDYAYYRALLALTRGRIEGHGGAAEVSGLKPSTLRSRIKKALSENIESPKTS